MITHYAPSYVLTLQNQIMSAIFHISQLQLAIIDHQLQACELILIDGQQLKRARQQTFDNLWFLCEKLLGGTAQYPTAVIKNPSSNVNGSDVLFKGVIVSMQPTILGGLQSSQGIKCQLLGCAAKLMYNPLADYIVAPPGTQNPVNLAVSGLGLNPAIKQPFSAYTIPIASLAQQTVSTTKPLQYIFAKTQQLIQKKKNQSLGKANIPAESQRQTQKIQDFIKSDWKIGDLLVPNKDKQAAATISPFVRQLNAKFIQLILQGAKIYQAVRNCLYGDTMLRIRPAGNGSCMYIEPDYLYKHDKSDSNASLTADQLLSLAPTVDVSQKLAQPGTLYVNFCRTCEFTSGPQSQQIKQNADGLYGTYVSSKQKKTFKFLPGPAWLSQYVGNQLLKQRSIDYKSIYDAFTKYKYFSTYNLSTTCTIDLVVSLKTLKLRDYVGKTIYVDTKEIIQNKQSNLFWRRIEGFYGVITSYRLFYSAAKDPQKTSEITLSIVVQRLTPKNSDMANIFEHGLQQSIQFFKK